MKYKQIQPSNKQPITMYIMLLLCASVQCFGFSVAKFSEKYETEETYTISLKNGDLITCNVVALVTAASGKQNMDSFIPYIIVRSFENEIILYEDEILDIIIKDYSQTLTNQYFLLPTANPISNNHFIGDWELMLFYAGIGITDWVSVTAGRTILPYTIAEEQVSLVNVKVSFPIIAHHKDLAIAIGGNMAWVNSCNKFLHFYGLATYNSEKLYNSNITLGIFYKYGYADYYNVNLFDGHQYPFNYADGAIGLCVGFERKLEKRKDLSILAEIWNSDISAGSNTGILFGFRLKGKHLRSDFGIAVFTTPFVLPFCSFVWTPFSKD